MYDMVVHVGVEFVTGHVGFSDMPYYGFRFWNFRSRSMMCSMEVYQELEDNILQFKFPARPANLKELTV